MNKSHLLGTVALALLLSASSLPTISGAEPVDFAHDVLPVLRKHCAKCHSGDRIEGDLSIESREALIESGVVEPGESAESDFLLRLTTKDKDEIMPPEGPPLSAKQISAIRRWIDEGAKWDEGVTLIPVAKLAPLAPRKPELPPVVEGRANEVDRFVDASFERDQVKRPQPLSEAAFMRRVSLDLVGLLPPPEEVATFSQDGDPNKRQRLIRSLLDNNVAYAEHWMTFWNDLLRNDYAGTGYIDGGRQQISGWLHRSLRENKPYDQFVRELIAPTKESEGFIRGIRWRGRVNASQVEEIQFAQNVGQVFLGINLKCASCHDSFIDTWKLSDSYALAAVVSNRPLELHRCDIPTGKKAKSAFLFPELGSIDQNLPREERLKQLAKLMTLKENGRLARTIVNRLWHRMMGRGLVHPVDMMDNEPADADLLDYLAVHLVENQYDLKKTLELIATSDIYQSQSVPTSEDPNQEYVFRGPHAKRLTAEQFVDAIRQITDTPFKQPAFKAQGRGDEPVRSSLVASDLLMRSLGRPNREQVVTTRPEDLTTLVALDLTNGPALEKLIAEGAKRLMADSREEEKVSSEQAITKLYLAAISRAPSDDEMRLAKEIAGEPLTQEGVADLLWTLCMLPEFQLVR